MGGDDAAAALDKVAQLLALWVGEGGDVGEDQGLEVARVFCVQETVMHHLKGNTRLDQRMIVAQRVVFHFRLALVAAVIVPGLLRIDNGDAGDGRFVA